MENNSLQQRAMEIVEGMKKGTVIKGAAKSLFEVLVSDYFDEIGLFGEGRFDAATMILWQIESALFSHGNPCDISDDDIEYVIDMFDTENHGLF